MKTKFLPMLTNLSLVLILGLVWISNANTYQVNAQGRINGDPASQSKREVKFDHSQPGLASTSISNDNVLNSGFENGVDDSWTEYSALGYELITNSTDLPTGVTPHAGQWAVWLGGDDNETSYISQSVPITTGASTLSFWEWIGSVDTCNNDFGEIRINDSVVYSFSLCTTTSTHGWVNMTQDLGAYTGQIVNLQIRVETNSSLNSNLFIDDVTLVGENYVYLPCIYKNYCSYHYFDDFSNPASGWESGDDSDVTYGYLSGEYQILLKNPNSPFAITPDLVLPSNYRIEVDAFQPSTAQGSFGIIFGTRFATGNQWETYLFLVDPQYQNYLLEKRALNGTWSLIIAWTNNTAINLDTSNHLRVDRVGTQISLYINGVPINTVTDASFTSAGRDAGVRVYSYDDAPVDTRFDNFSASCLP